MENKRLCKSRTDKKIFGVCGGVAKYLGVDPTIIRLIWALCVAFLGFGLITYLLAALIMPEDNTEKEI